MKIQGPRFHSIVACFVLLLNLPTLQGFAQGDHDRGGFTLLLAYGPGMQSDAGHQTSTVGFGGLRMGMGHFLKNDLAVILRASATNINHDNILVGSQTAGLLATSLQYWPIDRLYLEAGPGISFRSRKNIDGSQLGIGMLVGTGAVIYSRGKHSLQIGLEYAPAFLVGDRIHNVGISLGYQLL